VTTSASDAFWMSWGKYLDHFQPLDGPPCVGCMAGSTPREGCEEGVRLWDEYKKTVAPRIPTS
jgi:hypothetical protein